jgi:vacuolar-type H+-ATPase subunit F/Vma7
MKAFVVGTAEDVTGFALAGIEGVVCSTDADADAAIARTDADTLIIVSAVFAREADPARMLVVLPEKPPC